MIPFSPPRIDQKTIEAVKAVLESGWITSGPKLKEFEGRLQEYLGGPEVLALGSWTEAAELALRWYGIGPGDEVIVPAYTYAASANIVAHTGATPVLCDIEHFSFLVDPSQIKEHFTPRTKAVMSVDMGGLPVDYDAIRQMLTEAPFEPSNDVQKRLGRPLYLADAAHSFGAIYKDEPVGNHADITGFSFHAVKNLTTAEGGALAFNLPDTFDMQEVLKWYRAMALHGQTKDAFSKIQGGSWRYDIIAPGFKCNMTDIQAAIGLVELDRYKETLARRAAICERYEQGLEKYEWAILPDLGYDDCESSYHLFMLRIEGATEAQRDEMIRHIQDKGVSVNVHFMPLPMLTAYKNMGFRMENYPNAFNMYRNEISLPVYYDLTDDQVDTVIHAVIQAAEEVLS
ncbi:MAG: DegT/DnrJ/EryC1/StrS family aminotransferase [Flavobacteriales bacterium]|nr:DegT/DnrJ/EryC1/StrS family aminotransferase [Flavobacteriales bacterium]